MAPDFKGEHIVVKKDFKFKAESQRLLKTRLVSSTAFFLLQGFEFDYIYNPNRNLQKEIDNICKLEWK